MFVFDLHAVALFRIALGVLLLADLTIRLGDFELHYTEAGVLPLAEAGHFIGASPLLPLHLMSDAAGWQVGLFWVGIFFASGIVIGFQTRACVLGAWLVLGAIHARNPLVLYGADTFLMGLLLWGVFLPLGDRWGCDSARFGWRGKGTCLSVGTLALVIQIVVVYWGGFLSKSGVTWWNGEAVGGVLQLDQYASSWGSRLLAYPVLLRYLTWATLLIEALAPLLLLLPRGWARISGVALLGFLQVGFAVFMELGLFPFVSLAALVPFLPVGPNEESKRPSLATLGVAARMREGLGLGCLLIMILWNGGVSRLEFQRTRLKAALPDVAVGVVERLRLDQSWSMFSPDPPTEDGWLVFEATLVNGERVDLWRPEDGLDWEKPESVSGSFRGDRWKAYFLNLIQRRLSWQRFAEVLVNDWESRFGGGRSVRKLTVHYMKESLDADGNEGVEPVVLIERHYQENQAEDGNGA